MSTIKVNTVTKRTGSTLTLGESGTTVTLACGATQTGFGRSGSVNWQTTPKTATFTAVNGEGYFANTSGGAFTINLPAGSAGAIVAVSDYTRTFATNNLTIAPNGSEKIGGVAETLLLDINGQALTLVYVDATEGWINVQNAEDTETGLAAAYVTATGGTITTSGDFKIHTFNADATFTVSCAGNPKGSDKVDYIVVAGAGGGGRGTDNGGGGGGAGGFRMSNSYSLPAPTTSPLASPTGLPVSVQAYPVTVGAGGAGGSPPSCSGPGCSGSNSIFSTITSTGGGGAGGVPQSTFTGLNGGSGGGGAGESSGAGGTGNTPPVSPSQGFDGGSGSSAACIDAGGGGGGAAAVGGNAPNPDPSRRAGDGGIGSFASPSFAVSCAGTPGPVGSVRYFSGGGGGASGRTGPTGAGPGTAGNGGSGGGGIGGTTPGTNTGTAGTANTGGGGGGGTNCNSGGAGGSGIVIIRYKFQN
jgi:hypothetical protein